MDKRKQIDADNDNQDNDQGEDDVNEDDVLVKICSDSNGDGKDVW